MIVKKILIIIMIIFILTAVLNITLTYTPLASIKAENITCFKFGILNHNFLGLWNKTMPLGVKILGNSNYNHNIIGAMDGVLSKSIVVQNSNMIRLYDIEGNLIDTVDMELSDEKIVSTAIADLDKNGHSELLIITGTIDSDYGNKLRIFEYNGKLHESFTQDFGEMNPWKVQTADVDGDGRPEISIAMYKTAVFHNVLAKRPYIYNWHGNAISPMWRGSRLSKPFTDYVFADLDNDSTDELIAIEELEDGRKVINSYKWKGFGFEGLSESDSFEDVLEIRLQPSDKNMVFARVKEGSKTKWATLSLSNGRFTVIKEFNKLIPEF